MQKETRIEKAYEIAREEYLEIGVNTNQAIDRGEVSSLTRIREVTGGSFDFKEYLPENTNQWDINYSRFLEACENIN